MKRPVHFEIQVANPERAIEFYRNVFGWQAQAWEGAEGYYMVNTGEGEGINGAIMKSPDGQARTINTMEVNSVDEYLGIAVNNGAQVAHPKMAIPGAGYVAYCIDPSGSVFGIYQNDPSAK